MARMHAETVPRRRKVHSKSLRGCRNCKLRRVKCDEKRPGCKRCSLYGVLCSYEANGPDLQMSFEIQDQAPVIADAILSSPVDKQVAGQLVRFQTRTLETIFKVRWEEVLFLAVSRPYLMHSILALSALHDRYLHSTVPGIPSTFETFYFASSLALLNQSLSQRPIRTEDWDALWLTATFLGTITFASVKSGIPHNSWPLKLDDSTDLEWVRMAEGKKAIWDLTQPLRPGSFLESMNEEYREMLAENSCVESAPRILLSLCNITPASTSENNPYFTALTTILRLQRAGKISRADALAFTSQMTGPFRKLLRQKDPVALLLLALWYERVGQALWWTRARAMVEAQSICEYLGRYHRGHRVIQLLVGF